MYEPIVVKGLKNPDGTVIAEYFGKPQIGFVAVRETDASNYPIHGLDDFKIPGMVKGVLEERETVEQHLDRLLCKYGALLYVTYNPSTNVVTQKLQAGQNVYTRTFAYNSWSNWSSDSLVLTSEMNTALAGKANTEHTHDADDVYWNPQGAEHSYPISGMMVSITHDVEQLNTTTQGIQEDVDELKTRANDLEIGKAPLNHVHDINDVNGLSTRLGALDDAVDGKADTNHTHTIANVTGLQDALDGKAAASHTHTKSQITDFAHGHEISEVTGLQSALDGKADAKPIKVTPNSGDGKIYLDNLKGNFKQWYYCENTNEMNIGDLFMSHAIEDYEGPIFPTNVDSSEVSDFVLFRFYELDIRDSSGLIINIYTFIDVKNFIYQ